MLPRRRPAGNSKRKVEMEIKNFAGGSNLLLDEARLAPNESKQARNLIQVEDGLWKTRWGTAYYTPALPWVCDGAKEYFKSDGTTELIAVAGGHVFKSIDGGSWIEIEVA